MLATETANTVSQALEDALPVDNKAPHNYSDSVQDILRQVPYLVGQDLVPRPNFGWQIGCPGQILAH